MSVCGPAQGLLRRMNPRGSLVTRQLASQLVRVWLDWPGHVSTLLRNGSCNLRGSVIQQCEEMFRIHYSTPSQTGEMDNCTCRVVCVQHNIT